MINAILYLLGICTVIIYVLRLGNFLAPYLKPSRLKKYRYNGAYALVTGATDGIGKAMALQLAHNGFNVIIHGRNLSRLQSIEKEIKNRTPNSKVVLLLHDGSLDTAIDTSAISTLPITILVNNVGMGPIGKFAAMTHEQIQQTITLNTVFPSHLTRDMLVYMQPNSLILNVSSYAGLLPPPYLAVYAATKAYNNAFSISLSREMENVEVISLLTGSVNTGSNTKPVSFLRPSAEKYAKAVLGIVGCGKQSIMPYWPHAVQTWMISLLPAKLIDRATKAALEKELDSTSIK